MRTLYVIPILGGEAVEEDATGKRSQSVQLAGADAAALPLATFADLGDQLTE